MIDDQDIQNLIALQNAVAAQARAGMKQTAEMVGSFRKDLISEGFGRQMAEKMARDYMNAIFDLTAQNAVSE